MVSYAANVKKNTTPIREHWQYGDDRHAATRLPFTGAMEGRFSSAAAGGPCDASSGDLDSPWVARDEPVERFIPFPVASIPSRQYFSALTLALTIAVLSALTLALTIAVLSALTLALTIAVLSALTLALPVAALPCQRARRRDRPRISLGLRGLRPAMVA